MTNNPTQAGPHHKTTCHWHWYASERPCTCNEKPEDTTAQADALLPCPFCGGEAIQDENDYVIRCDTGCTARVNSDYKDEAIAAWNIRAHPVQPVGADVEEAFNAGKAVGEVAGKVAVESLERVRYEKEKLELAYQQLLSQTRPAALHTTPQPTNHKAVELLQKWLSDNSGYDEEVWPRIKAALETPQPVGSVVEALQDIALTAQMASQHEPEQFCEWAYNRAAEALEAHASAQAAQEPVSLDESFRVVEANLRAQDKSAKAHDETVARFLPPHQETASAAIHAYAKSAKAQEPPSVDESPGLEELIRVAIEGVGFAQKNDGWLVGSTTAAKAIIRMLEAHGRLLATPQKGNHIGGVNDMVETQPPSPIDDGLVEKLEAEANRRVVPASEGNMYIDQHLGIREGFRKAIFIVRQHMKERGDGLCPTCESLRAEIRGLKSGNKKLSTDNRQMRRRVKQYKDQVRNTTQGRKAAKRANPASEE